MSIGFVGPVALVSRTGKAWSIFVVSCSDREHNVINAETRREPVTPP